MHYRASRLTFVFVLDVQSELLSYLAQESFTHGALVFAILVAAFTFATGFDKRLLEKGSYRSYFLIIFLTLFAAAYAALGRTVLYGALAWKTILTDPTSCPSILHIPQNVNLTLGQYLKCVNGVDYNSLLIHWSNRCCAGSSIPLSEHLWTWHGNIVASCSLGYVCDLRIAAPGQEFTLRDVKWLMFGLSLVFLLLAIYLTLRTIRTG